MVANNARLTQRQLRFVQEYLTCFNAAQAAIRAGFSERTAKQQGSRLLTNVDVKREIEAGTKKADFGLEITRERIANELARIAFGDPRKVMSWGSNGVTLLDSNGLTSDEAAQVAEVSQTITQHGGTIRLKRYDKVKALELLGRMHGMFGDDGEDGEEEEGNVVFYLPGNGR